MTKDEELSKDTEQLKQLISQVDNSGISAWIAGDLLKTVKIKEGYKSKFKTFENYTKKEIGINPQTANNYIAICVNFTKEEIGNLMLVTHLKVIAGIQNDKIRKIVLKKFKERELVNKEKPEDNEPIYKTKLADIVGTVSMIVDSGETEYTEEQINDIIELNIQKGKEYSRRKKRGKKQPKGTDEKAKFGNKFKSDYFGDVTAIIENEPINEMGVVALFCVMFQTLRGTQFEWKNEILSFVAIKYVRVEFPDACIRCKKVKHKDNFEIDVEFEFESYNYIRHRHLQSSKNCDLIVCWEENAKTDDRLKENGAVKSMPPILCLKKCFESGEIELI